VTFFFYAVTSVTYFYTMKQTIVFLILACTAPLTAQEFILEKLPEFINSPYNEISPVPSRDGQTLFFTRIAYPNSNPTLFIDSIDQHETLSPQEYASTLKSVYKQIAGGYVADPVLSAFNQDVWMATGDSLGFTVVSHPPFPLNNALPNSLVAITPDPNAFYVINRFERNGNMDRGFSIIRRVDSTWSFPEPVEIKDFYTITSDVSLTMSFDGEVLILSATRFDSRDMDLYVCFREGENKWSAPKNMGSVLNSSQREITPFLSEDNMTLYFSSNRWESRGGNDIFVSKRLDETWQNWTIPQRLIEPINSGKDESQPYFNMTSGFLYFASRRDGNQSDIFRVQIAPPQATEITVKGRVLNAKTRELITDANVYYNNAKGGTPNVLHTDNGVFTLKIPKGVPFLLKPEKPAFAGKTDTILFRRDYYFFREFYVELLLTPLEAGAKIELQPIFFQQSKAIILESSYPELERLAAVMHQNSKLRIRIEGHTDNVGKAEDLMQLSKERADAIRTFLMEKNIEGNRIDVVGHGPKYPLSDNSSDQERAKNRRVEFIITKI